MHPLDTLRPQLRVRRDSVPRALELSSHVRNRAAYSSPSVVQLVSPCWRSQGFLNCAAGASRTSVRTCHSCVRTRGTVSIQLPRPKSNNQSAVQRQECQPLPLRRRRRWPGALGLDWRLGATRNMGNPTSAVTSSPSFLPSRLAMGLPLTGSCVAQLDRSWTECGVGESAASQCRHGRPAWKPHPPEPSSAAWI